MSLSWIFPVSCIALSLRSSMHRWASFSRDLGPIEVRLPQNLEVRLPLREYGVMLDVAHVSRLQLARMALGRCVVERFRAGAW